MDKRTGTFIGVEKFYEMVERTGSQDSAQAATNPLTQSRRDTEMAFQSAGAKFVQSTEPTWVVQADQS